MVKVEEMASMYNQLLSFLKARFDFNIILYWDTVFFFRNLLVLIDFNQSFYLQLEELDDQILCCKSRLSRNLNPIYDILWILLQSKSEWW